MRKLSLGLFALLAALGVNLTPIGGVAAQETVTLRLSHFVPPSFILFQENSGGGMMDWIKSVEEASEGTINIEIFPAQQLGGAADHYDMAKNGIADITMTTPGYTPGRFPIVSLAEVPMTITDGRTSSAAFWAWYRQYADYEMGDVKVLHAYVMEPMLLHTRQPVTMPADLDGMKLRPTHGTLGRFFTLLGATTSQVPVTEARDLLERGIVDGLTLQWGSVVAFGIVPHVEHHLDLKMATGAVLTVMNKDSYEGLSAEHRQIIDAHSTPYWAMRISTPWSMWDVAGRDQVAAMEGHEIHTLTPEQVEAWREAARPVLDAWAEAVKERFPDLDPMEMYQQFQNELQRAHGLTWAVYE